MTRFSCCWCGEHIRLQAALILVGECLHELAQHFRCPRFPARQAPWNASRSSFSRMQRPTTLLDIGGDYHGYTFAYPKYTALPQLIGDSYAHQVTLVCHQSPAAAFPWQSRHGRSPWFPRYPVARTSRRRLCIIRPAGVVVSMASDKLWKPAPAS